MAHYSESGYCAEEMNRPAAYYGEGGERYGGGHRVDEHGHGHEGRHEHYGGGHRVDEHGHHHEGLHENYGGGHRVDEHGHGHGHGYDGRPYDACESKHYA